MKKVNTTRDEAQAVNDSHDSDITPGPLLSKINSPADLRCLDRSQLPEICSEIRNYLIKCLSENPGHFGSSMGAVEIAVALHYVFNTPRDRIVWDVGHQAYAHKLLTGRRDAFRTQRTKNGISGFPFPAESEYDTFVCGHAGNSISAALGMATADLNTPGESDRHTVAIIGDASIGNGLAFEGLNNASNNPNNLLIILNDNDMSIDDNVGALHRYLTRITTSRWYNRQRQKLYLFCRRHGLIKEKGKGLMLRFNNAVKALVSQRQNIFEGLNIRYFGPFNGNDVEEVVKVLNEIKDMSGPRILHLRTSKGKGYAAAEENPQAWHAPGKFDPETCEKIVSKGNLNWQNVFGDTLVRLADHNENIVGITAAMLSGTSMSKMMATHPSRTFDVGISEGHAVTFAGGLASAGKKPYVAIYSSFLQRAFDNIIHDVAIQGLPVVFCIDRSGLVGEDGVTHHGLFDISFLRIIPGMTVASPMDAATMCCLMKTAEDFPGPIAIRYPRGRSDRYDDNLPLTKIPVGKGRKVFTSGISAGNKAAILSFGPCGADAIDAACKLQEEMIAADVFDMIWAKPLDEELLREIASDYQAIITIEDGIRDGGFGSAVTEWLSANDIHLPLTRLGVPDIWIRQGTVGQLHEQAGFNTDAIVDAVKGMVGNN